MSTPNTSTFTYEPLGSRASTALEAPQARGTAIPELNDKGRMADIPLSAEAKITVERRGEIVLIGVNRPRVYNRFDPDAFFGLAQAYYDFDNDPSLRAAVFFGHGENFSRGIDVDAFAPLARTGNPFAIKDGMLDPFARTQQLSKPLIVVVHGDTWNMGHELHLVADIRVAIGLAQKIAACGPLGIKTTLESADLSIDESEAAAFARLSGQFGGLFRTEDFIEGREAEAEGRPPVYQGK